MESELSCIKIANKYGTFVLKHISSYIVDAYYDSQRKSHSNSTKISSNLLKYFKETDDKIEQFLGMTKAKNERQAIESVNKLLDKEHDNTHKYYMIEDITNGNVIGIVYYYDNRPEWQRTKISYGLLKEYRGFGIATNIIKQVIAETLNSGFCRVEMAIETTNNDSLHLMKQLLQCSNILEEGIRHNEWGKGVDCYIYAALKN